MQCNIQVPIPKGYFAIKINKDQTLLLLPLAKIYLIWVHHVIDCTEYVCIQIFVYNSCLKAHLGFAFLSNDKYDLNDTSSSHFHRILPYL